MPTPPPQHPLARFARLVHGGPLRPARGSGLPFRPPIPIMSSTPETRDDDAAEGFLVEAPAKTNLSLRILGKREDGFHEIDTRMVALDLADRLRLRWREDDRVVLECSDPDLPLGEDNLAVKAVRALEAHTGKTLAVTIELEKRIPSGAGLGGGSSDAAAVLRALDEMAALGLPEEELADVGAGIGSDVPFFVYRRPCLCRGRGEIVEPLTDPPPALPLLLVKPPFGIPAAWAYSRYAASSRYEGFCYEVQEGPWGSMENDLERPVFEKFPLLGEMKGWLLDQDEVAAALLSGSGSTMLAVLHPEAAGDTAAGASLVDRVRARYGESFWTYLGSSC